MIDGSLGLSNGRHLATAGNLDVSGDVYMYGSSTLTVNGALKNEGYIDIEQYSGGGTGLLEVQGGADNTGTFFVYNETSDEDTLPTASKIRINGALAQQQGDVLTAGSYSLNQYHRGTGAPLAGSEASIAWHGANIRVIGENASVALDGEKTFLRDLSGGDALANFAENRGYFSIRNRDFTTAGNMLNTGGSSDDYYDYYGAAFTVGPDAQFIVSGDLTNTGGLGVGGYDYDGGLSRLAVAGNLSNTGGVSVQSSGAYIGEGASSDAILTVQGGLAQLQEGVLTDGAYSVNGPSAGGSAILEWTGADVQVIGEDASVSILGANAAIRDRVSGLNAFRNLREVDGSFSYFGATDLGFSNGLKIGENGYADLGTSNGAGTFAVTGDLDLLGSLYVSGNLPISGTLVQNTGNALTGGYLGIGGGVASWAGARIDTIASGAGISLSGGASIRNSTNAADALSTLSRIDGSLNTSNSSLATGPLTVGVDGYLSVYSGYADTTITVNGAFSNEGTIDFYSDAYDGNRTAKLDIAGPLAQQSGTTLTGGWWYLSAYSGSNTATTIVQWEGANIETIGANADVYLEGENARILNRTNGADALAGLK